MSPEELISEEGTCDHEYGTEVIHYMECIHCGHQTEADNSYPEDY